MDERESEKRFLEAYRQADYERPSVVADIALFKLSTQKPDSFRKDPVKKLSLLPANIRRKVAALVEETDEFTEGAVYRPAKLYRREAVLTMGGRKCF